MDLYEDGFNFVSRRRGDERLRPDEIAMVGDNSHDMEEALNGGAGMAIGVLTGNAAHDDIAHLADHVLSSVADIPKLLKRLG